MFLVSFVKYYAWSAVSLLDALNMLQYRKLSYRHYNNSVALVRERTIPTEQPALVNEVSANFCG
jgi:hypothetical protein